MAGIFTLGFIGGAANAFSERQQAQAEQAAEERAFERQKELYKFQAEQQFQFDQASQLLGAGIQKDIEQFASGIRMEEYEQTSRIDQSNRMSLAGYEAQLQKGLITTEFANQQGLEILRNDLSTQSNKARDLRLHDLQKEILGIQQSMRKDELGLQQGYSLALRAYENQLSLATTQEQRTYIENRIKELNTQAQTAARMGEPFVLPAGYTGYGFDKAFTAGTGISGATPMAGVDADNALFYFKNRFGQQSYVPAVDTAYHKSDTGRTNQKIFNVMDAVGNEVWWHIENGDPHGLLGDVRTQLVTNISKSAIRQDLILNKDESGTQYIQNPVEAFSLLSQLRRDGKPDRVSQEWWIDNILSPQLGVSSDAIKEAIGMPKELQLTYDEVNDMFVAPPESTYEWAREYVGVGSPNYNPDVTNSYQLSPEVWNNVKTIRDDTGMAAVQIMSAMSSFQDPRAALAAFTQDREITRNYVRRSPETGALKVDPDFKTRMYPKIKDLPPEVGIQLVRTFVEKDDFATPAAIQIEAGETKVVYNKKFRDMYNINREDARQRGYAAKQALTVIKQMEDLLATGDVTAGRVGQAKKTLAGVGELVQDFNNLVTEISGPQNQEALTGIQAKLVDVQNNPNISDSARLQYVFDLLGETLAYYQAAALQGGAQGRDISNQDVQFQREKLGLTGLAIYSPGVMDNLNYLKDQMTATSAIYNGYANSGDMAGFEAVYLYDQVMGGMAPVNYAEMSNGAPNQYEGQGEVVEQMIGEDYVERVVNGEVRRFPKVKLFQ